MEPDVMHSSSPPPLDGDVGVGSEVDEFGDLSCSRVDEIKPLSLFRPASKPETHQPYSSWNHPAEQSRHTATVKSESEGRPFGLEEKHCNTSLYLTNGSAQEEEQSGSSVGGACSPKEEAGFADFTVFTEQASHPWCCGLTEQWDAKAVGVNSSVGEETSAGQEVIMEYEPRSHKARKDVKLKHCDIKDGRLVQPAQDHHQPQDASGETDPGMPQDCPGERRCSCASLQTSEDQIVTETFPMYDSTSDLASFSDDLSFEGVSADLEPNVSSLGSDDDRSDCDRTDDEQEELENYRLSACLVSSSLTNLSLSEQDLYHCGYYATQETSATSSQPQSGTSTTERAADVTDGSHEHQLVPESVQSADPGAPSRGRLPLSDSFADFCSAPTREDGEEAWADFKAQSAELEEKPELSSLQTEEERAGPRGAPRRNSCQASLSCRVQQLFQSSFPDVLVPAVEGEEELLVFSGFTPESEEETPELSHAQRIHQVMLGPHQDVHSSVGLQFQWNGSHSNRTLLGCLGVDERNIVFIGRRKQPVTVPAYASGLQGMLEPMKDCSVPAVCSPKRSAIPASPREKPNTSPRSVQEELPSTQLDWTSRGLSSSQGGTSPHSAVGHTPPAVT